VRLGTLQSGLTDVRRLTPPATEPLTLDEAKAFCRLDGTNAEPKPPAITAVALAAPAAPGNVDNGAHRYLATFVTSIGETEAGVVSAAVPWPTRP
jgi:hypothetical protein